MKKTITTIIVLAGLVLSILFPVGCKEPGPIYPNVTASASNVNPTLAAGLTIDLTGGAAITEGSVVSYEWSAPTKPSGVTISFGTPTDVNTTVSGLTKAGTYVFQLAATSAAGVTGTKTVTVTVAPMTKNVTVPVLSLANPLNFGTVASFGGWDSDFLSSDVTYTVTLRNSSNVVVETISSTNTTSIGASGRPNGYYTLTQTFYYKDVAISNGSRSVVLEVDGDNFADMHATMPPPYTTVSMPALNLLLSKDTL